MTTFHIQKETKKRDDFLKIAKRGLAMHFFVDISFGDAALLSGKFDCFFKF